MRHFLFIAIASLSGVSAVGMPQQADTVKHITATTPGFACGESDIRPLLPALQHIGEQADSLMSLSKLRQLRIRAHASADGPTGLNEELAARRAKVVQAWFLANTHVPQTLTDISASVAEWTDVDTLICTGRLASPYRASVLQTIRRGGTHDATQSALKELNGGEAWQWLADDVLPLQRTTVIDLVADKVISTTLRPGAQPSTTVQPTAEECVAEEATAIVPGTDTGSEFQRHLYLKTNIPAWGMLWANAAVEIDLASHWSFTIPVYYSGLNYFTGHTKFRTLALQPELRWWPKHDNTGFFAGAHFGLGWYNVAFGGDYRYQDHDRRTPAIGGGVAAGYRFHFCRNHRWQMEASVGAGIYRLDYDMFQNHVDGLLVGRRKRTFYGIDQAAFTISYRFDIGGRKGGDR